MKLHRRLMATPVFNQKTRNLIAFNEWLANQPGNVRRAPRAEQQRQFRNARYSAMDARGTT